MLDLLWVLIFENKILILLVGSYVDLMGSSLCMLATTQLPLDVAVLFCLYLELCILDFNDFG